MLQARDRRFASLPKYLAQLPWIGPIQGAMFPEEAAQFVRIGAACDPLFGNALGVACLPVAHAGGRFTRQAGSGWVSPVRADAGGRFSFAAPLQWWGGTIAGILMLLVYDRSSSAYDPATRKNVGRNFPASWSAQLEHFASKLDPDLTWPIAELPEDMRRELERRIGQVLQRPAAELEAGLVELKRHSGPELTFAVASCQYPAGFLDRDVAQRSYERLRARVEARDDRSSPECLLLLGDQVYVDATAGLFDPSTLSDRFDLPYERLLQMEPLQHVLRRIPAHTMLDDHEIEDNWEPPSGDPTNLRLGREHYLAYQRIAALPPQPRERLWYSFAVNGFPFFMADTRTDREARTATNFATARIIKPAQFDALIAWLDQHDNDVPKFIASPAAFLPRHRRATHGPRGAGALRSDGWDGYPASLHALIKHIAERKMRNVVFLSGDEHISFVSKARIHGADGEECARIVSIHSSGLYAPFAFANSTQDSLASLECFDAGGFRCDVSTQFAPFGDGFALLRCWQENGRWRIRCLFDREPPAPSAWTDLA